MLISGTPAARLRWTFALAASAVVLGAAYGVGLGAAVSPLLLAGAPLALLVAWLAFARPDLAAVVLLGLTWGYISEIANRFHGLPSLSKSLVALLVASLLLRRFGRRQVPLVVDSAVWWMAGYLGVVVLGLAYARAPERTVLLVVDFAKDLLLFLVLINVLRTPRHVERCIWGLLAVGALLGTLTVVQEATQSYANTFGGLARAKFDAEIATGFQNRPRAGGPTREPLAFAQQLLVLVPLGLWGVLHGRTGRSRAFAAYAVMACLAGIGLSFSRSSYLALAVALGLFALHIRLKPRYLVLLAVLVGSLGLAAPPELTARFATLGALLPGGTDVSPENSGLNSEASYRMRYVQLQMALEMAADHPLTGIGGWNFVELYPSYVRQSGSPYGAGFGPPHNYYIEILTEHGLLGLTVVSAILVIALRRLGEAQRRFTGAGDQRMAELAAALRIGFIGYLVSAAFLHGLYSRFLWLQVSLAVALALVARHAPRTGADRSTS